MQDADRVRSFLASDPHAVRNARFPEYLLTDAIILITVKLAEKGLAFRPSLNPAEMKTAREVIDSYKDIVELLIAQRAPRNGIYHALFDAVQLPDTEVARLLLEYGVKALKACEKNSLLDVVSGIRIC